MAGKPRPLIIEKKDFHVYLIARISASFGGSVQGLADFLGVSGSRVYAMLSGEEGPTDEMLQRLSLRAVYVLDIQEPEEEPENTARKKKA